MEPKSERFEMRLDQTTINRLDAWRSRQDGLPSRAEAMRRLVEAGLGRSRSNEVRLGDADKLILIMLCGLYKHLGIEGGVDPEFVEAVIDGGHYWALSWKYPGIFHGDVDNWDTVQEVLDVLDMWSAIERGYERLSKEDKQRIEKEVGPLGKHVRFRGFDGNNETEYMSIARFLVDDLDRFAEFKGRDLNAHMPTLDAHRRMLTVFKPMQPRLMGGDLNTAQIIALLKEQIHPENRQQ